jgi:hypothetical protein
MNLDAWLACALEDAEMRGDIFNVGSGFSRIDEDAR